MSSQASACSGFFQEHANTALNQYFQQLNSSGVTAASIGSSSNSDSGNDGSSVTSSTMETNRSSVSSIESAKSVSGGNNNANTQWNNMQQQQQQQQQQHQQQHHQQQQQQHMHQQHQQQQHNSHQQHHHQQQQSNAQQQQHAQQQQQHQQAQQQQQQQQHHHHAHSQLSALSQSLSQSLSAASAANATNTHSIFGTGNFHYKTNNSWSIPTLSCYQRLYNENHQHYQRGFGNGGGGGTVNGGGNSTETSSTPNGVNAAATAATNCTGGTGNAGSGVVINGSAGVVPNAASVQHVANAVAAAVMASEHQNHLNNLKARFQPTNTGKSTSNNKEVICGDDKYKEEGDPWNIEAQTAFLGPNLWDKTLPYDADLKYADLDEFLSENNIPDGLPGTHLGHSSGLGHRSDSLGHAAGLSLGLGHITTKRERSPSPSDCISPETLNPPSPAESIFDIPAFSFASSGRDFDPRTRAFSDEELKPQPMIKKSRKQFVPDELKDDKYWARRRKNNIAAKRSRDARRQKENQIAMRARYLEKENSTLHQEVEQLKQENMDLRARLSKFQDV